jgi:hypothetical protein
MIEFQEEGSNFAKSPVERVRESASSNVGYHALNALTFQVHSVKMPLGFGKAETTIGSSHSMMAHLKRSIA